MRGFLAHQVLYSDIKCAYCCSKVSVAWGKNLAQGAEQDVQTHVDVTSFFNGTYTMVFIMLLKFLHICFCPCYAVLLLIICAFLDKHSIYTAKRYFYLSSILCMPLSTVKYT